MKVTTNATLGFSPVASPFQHWPKGQRYCRSAIYFSFILLLLVPFSTASAQEEATCDALVVANSWARPALAVTGTGAVYGTIANLSSTDDTLIAASTDAAEVVEFHLGSMDENGVMSMSPIEDGIPVGAGRAVEIAPAGIHIMLINLTQDLVDGETLDLTLTFENAGDLTATILIHEPEPEMDAPEAEHHQHDETPSLAVLGECEAGIYAAGVWARPSVTSTGAAYGYIFNFTDQDETLTGATTEIAEVVEFHTMTMEGDVMTMTPVEGGIITIPANGVVQFKPGGLHFMFINLTDTLDAGQTLEMTLTFEEAGEVKLTLPIEEPLPIMEEHSH